MYGGVQVQLPVCGISINVKKAACAVDVVLAHVYHSQESYHASFVRLH